MPFQQFQSDDTPRPQRMTAEEAKAVIDLWTQQQDSGNAPSVNDVAEGLNIPADQVEQLLRQVRTHQSASKPIPALRSGWKLIEANHEEATSGGWWERIGWTSALLVVSYLVAEWTLGTAFTLSPNDNTPLEGKWFIGGADFGLWIGLSLGWRALIRWIKRKP